MNLWPLSVCTETPPSEAAKALSVPLDDSGAQFTRISEVKDRLTGFQCQKINQFEFLNEFLIELKFGHRDASDVHAGWRRFRLWASGRIL